MTPPDKAAALFLTRLIAPGYSAGFLSDPLGTASAALAGVDKFDLIQPITGTDFKGLFGQEVVPYGLVLRRAYTGQVYWALRGTDSGREWMENGFALPEPWPFAGHTHKGITDVYQTLSVGPQRLADYLRGKNAIGTGHSLGAGLANLLAADLGADCQLCVSFEGPRVGDSAFCDWMDSRVSSFFRYIIIGDVVPHAPPEWMGYRHAGMEIELDPGKLLPFSSDPLKELGNLHVLSSVQTLLLADIQA
jgi:hypothetical protein